MEGGKTHLNLKRKNLIEWKESTLIKNNIDQEGSRERKSCQQLPPYHMPTTYVLMWKLLTSVLAEKVYVHLSAENALLDEQKE